MSGIITAQEVDKQLTRRYEVNNDDAPEPCFRFTRPSIVSLASWLTLRALALNFLFVALALGREAMRRQQ
ncbi:hypothetical protein PHLGIDRAFT_19761 [Phlebiopsis gigantea 11061_1 CR5-6]|uniref:Uncharacterized protein n=1 Tax=Phlebiopsis gigantea (strain 11061_1 CR5-6) TaxID=745531 RepID=A0A0C3S8E7_PHLG1|nr:hypothetical protein PHLGIDRAFT_19761 [Phlebiopsis gigantea 11061_1 CR5-6]